MADSLQPWIAPYLINVAEVHGADLAAINWSAKSQKGQIIRFLTDSHKEGAVWGMLSDGEFSVPVKFAKDAIEDDRKMNDDSMPDYCIVSVRKYKVIFCRAPQGNSSGLSADSRLVIECSAFTRSVRRPQEILGMPKGIASHPDLNVWSEGLKQHGGAGNILKQKRMPGETMLIAQKVPKLIARSKAHLPTELFVQFRDRLVYNDMDQQTRAVVAAPSSPEILISWPPTPVHTRLRASQVLLSDCNDDSDAPSSSLPEPQQATLEEEQMELDLERPVSYEQPYPTQSRKVPRLPSPKRLGGSGMVLVPNSDAGSSQPSQEPKPHLRALLQRDVNCLPEECERGKTYGRAAKQYPWPVVSARQILDILTASDRLRAGM